MQARAAPGSWTEPPQDSGGPGKWPDRLSYVLACEGGHGTTGQAVWDIDANRVRGTLNVKLGGKNMTFYQRITAVPRGRCFR
jgi:hypothetical protein